MTLFVIDNALPWSQILLIALIGISIVFVVLLLLVYVMRLFGFVFTREHKANNAKVPVAISDEEVVAIVTALKLYKAALHDQDSLRVRNVSEENNVGRQCGTQCVLHCHSVIVRESGL